MKRVEEYVDIVRMGGARLFRCLLCAGEGREFYTATLGDMTWHLLGVHQVEIMKPRKGNIVCLTQLDKPYEGICSVCSERKLLRWHMAFRDGVQGDLCTDCIPPLKPSQNNQSEGVEDDKGDRKKMKVVLASPLIDRLNYLYKVPKIPFGDKPL